MLSASLYALGAMLQGRANFFMDDAKSLGAERLSPVCFTAMSYSHHPHGLYPIINLIKNAIISNFNTPIVL